MALRNITGESGVDAAAEHSVPIKSDTNRVDFDSLTISTRGADIAADVKIAIKDGNRERWVAYLRSAQIFGGHFNDIGEIIITNGSCSIETSSGGGSVIVVVSAVCNVLP